ncbi:MAG: phosphoglycerate kinase [Comamonadaceae bacterium]|nr:MAG: phosphoglycerate kinase [Comamonadaceae bacterium]
MKLWLARHAQTLAAEGLCYGASDLAADPAATQAAALALAEAIPRHIRVRSSPLQRCAGLADALAALRPDLAWQPDARLAEMDFGCWEGRPWSEVPEEEFARWNADFLHYRFGGRESVRAFLARVEAAHADSALAAPQALWITHAGVIRAAGLLARGELPLDASQWPREAVSLGGWQQLAW